MDTCLSLGVDFQNNGRPQLDEALRLVQLAQNTIYIILMSVDTSLMIDHMAKPDLKQSAEDTSFGEWTKIITEFAFPTVYVKYSGLPSYLPSQASPEHLTDGLLSSLPWVPNLVQIFGPERIIWGSDWRSRKEETGVYGGGQVSCF